MSARRGAPAIGVTPQWCLVVNGQRALEYGVYPTKRQAVWKGDEICAGRPWLRPHVDVEQVWLSRRMCR